jgi:hypothetical protein
LFQQRVQQALCGLVGGLEFQRHLEMLDRLGMTPFLHEQNGQVELDVCQARVDAQRRRELLDGLIGPPLACQRRAEVVVCGRVAGIPLKDAGVERRVVFPVGTSRAPGGTIPQQR